MGRTPRMNPRWAEAQVERFRADPDGHSVVQATWAARAFAVWCRGEIKGDGWRRAVVLKSLGAGTYRISLAPLPGTTDRRDAEIARLRAELEAAWERVRVVEDVR